jgi:hypothetical protein
LITGLSEYAQIFFHQKSEPAEAGLIRILAKDAYLKGLEAIFLGELFNYFCYIADTSV